MTSSLVPRTSGVPSLPSGDRLVSAFFADKNERTLKAYQNDLEDFRSFLGAQDLNEAASRLFSCGPGEANSLVLDYRTSLRDRGLKAATVNRRLAALRSLVKLARTLGAVSWTLEIKSLKEEAYRDTSGPGEDGVRSLFSLFKDRKTPKMKRDYAILRLLWDLGLRRSSVVSLDLAHLDIDAGTVSVFLKGKENRKTKDLPPATKEALLEWIEVRGMDEGPLFQNFDRAGKGKRLSGTSVYRLIKSLGEKVGLNTRPHGIRHASITEVAKLSNGNVFSILSFSDHAKPETAQRYIDNKNSREGAFQVACLLSGKV